MWQRDISRIIILLVCTAAIPNSSASECGRLCDLQWMANATVAQVEAEVDAGADPLSPGKRGHTPLHVAAQANPNPSIAALLIEYGADIQARSLLYDGGTPLHVAAGGYGNSSRLHKLIVQGYSSNAGTGKDVRKKATIRKTRQVGRKHCNHCRVSSRRGRECHGIGCSGRISIALGSSREHESVRCRVAIEQRRDVVYKRQQEIYTLALGCDCQSKSGNFSDSS